MTRNARAFAAIILSGGLIGVTASPVFATTGNTIVTQADSFTDGDNTFQTTTTSALSTGMTAPGIDVGKETVLKGTVQYSNSTGTSDAFNVGTLSSIGASVSASSTPDYNVTSTANFGLKGSTINQVIGTSGANSSSSSQSTSDTQSIASSVAETQVESDFQEDTRNGGYWWWNRRNNKRTKISSDEYTSTKATYKASLVEDITKSISDSSGQSGTISGVFKKTDGTNNGESSNEVTVKGIGADNSILASDLTTFDTSIIKVGVSPTNPGDPSTVLNSGAGTASGSASGSVNTTASANANSSQFVSSFAQAY
tara:strand:- start:257 stop:1192 length:936 start_codon:yes stop_codon:yes gene_type:complete